MITLFRSGVSVDEFAVTVEVTFAKYAISLDNRHGKRPVHPIPLLKVAATIKVTLGGQVCMSKKIVECERD